MIKVERFIKEMKAQSLFVRHRYVAGINDGDLEHSQTNDEYLCGLIVGDPVSPVRAATVVWRTSGPLSEIFVITDDRKLEERIVDAFKCGLCELTTPRSQEEQND